MKRGGGGVEGRERVAREAAATMGLSSLSIEFPEVKGTAHTHLYPASDAI